MKLENQWRDDPKIAEMLDGMIHYYDVCFEMVLLYDELGSIMRWNQAASTRLNKHGELSSRNMLELLPNLFQMYNMRLYVEPCKIETVIKSILYPKDEVCIPVRIKLSYENVYGVKIGICLIEDLTELMENKLEKTEFMNQMVGVIQKRMEVMVRITHDLKTPVNGVFGLVESMEQFMDNPEEADSLRLMKDCCIHMKHMINQVLEHEELRYGEGKLKEEYVDLYRVIENVVALHKLLADEKELQIYVNISERIPNILYTDRVKISEILTNLMTNAIKFTQVGFISLNVLCCYVEENQMILLFMVGDTGPGIPEERWESIFEPYSRGTGGVGASSKGTGLGLAIVKQLVSRMNGSIKLESIVGEGSRFYFTIHVKLDEQEDRIQLQNIDSESHMNQWIQELKDTVVLDAEKQHFQKVVRMRKFGTKENKTEIFSIIESLNENLLKENWEKVEASFETMKLLIPESQHEIRKLLLRVELSARKYDIEKALTCLYELQEYLQKKKE